MWNFRCLSTTLVSLLVSGAAGRALQLTPIKDPSDFVTGRPDKRSTPDGLNLLPISDPGVLTHGRSFKREAPGNGCFDPSSQKSFFWGAYSGDNLYIANFTLSNPGDDEFILPVEDFAKRLKSIHCGSESSPYMSLQFSDQETFQYAKSAWNWVNSQDINHFTLVTEPDQCYKGDNRSPYLVKDVKFDSETLTANLHAEEKEWAELAHTFKLHLGHEYIDPKKVDMTHPHLTRREDSVLDLTHSWDLRLFEYAANSGETAGLKVTADAQISTGGQIISDFDIETTFFIPTDVKLEIRPQGLQALFQLKLAAEGKLGKPLDYALQPEIEIPVLALNIKGILEIGPFVTMGVHFGSTALEGTASVTTGAKATIDDAARINLKLRDHDDNGISGWTPQFEKLDTEISASIHGSVKAWAELGITIKAEAFGRWGYQAGLDAQLPYFEASLDAMYNENGVCGTQKTAGVELGASVGININLNAGEVDEAPKFQKDLFETSWPLFSTCYAFGGDVASPTQAPVATSVPVSETAAAPSATDVGIDPPSAPSAPSEPAPTQEPAPSEPAPTQEPAPSEPAATQVPSPTDAGTGTSALETPVNTAPPESSLASSSLPIADPTAPVGGSEPTATAEEHPISSSAETEHKTSASNPEHISTAPSETSSKKDKNKTKTKKTKTKPAATSAPPSKTSVPHYPAASSQPPAYGVSPHPPAYGASSQPPAYDASSQPPPYAASSESPAHTASSQPPAYVVSSQPPAYPASSQHSTSSSVVVTPSPTTTPCTSTTLTTSKRKHTAVYI